jgi:hypothetical protein
MSSIRQPDFVHYEEPASADIALAQRYDAWPDKGEVVDGRRLTIMTERRKYTSDDPVRVIHVTEVVEPGMDVYIMGPKIVYGEEFNDQLVTSVIPPDEDPFVPNNYDGVTLPSPAIDSNYLVTVYLPPSGTHSICWRLGRIASNTLQIQITGSSLSAKRGY